MNMDFLSAVNKSSGTPFKPSGSPGAAEPGFKEQFNRVMSDNDRKNEYVVEKRPAGQKKPSVAGQQRNSVKAGEKSAAPGKSQKSPKSPGTDRKYADNKTATVQAAELAKKTPGTSERKAVPAGEDHGFYGELKESETSETENVYMSVFSADETSGTENAYMFAPAPDETPALNGFEDASFSSSDSAQVFQADLNNDDSATDGMIIALENVENAGADDGSDAAQNVNTGAAPVAVSEVISQMVASRMTAFPPRETAKIDVSQNDSLPGGDAAAGAKELLAAAGDVELAESARPDMQEVPGNALLQKDPLPEQSFNYNAAAARGGEAKNEAPQEYKPTADAGTGEVSKQAAASSEDDDLLFERMAAQALRPRESADSAKTSEHAGKTVHAAHSSVQSSPGTAKAESSAPVRSADAPDKDFVVELAGRIQAQIRGGREMVRIQLHPEELGRLEIHAESGRNGIIARIAAESADVKKLLESNLQNLQQTLEARGIKIDRLQIVVEDNAYAAFADGGRYGNAGTGLYNPETSEFSTPAGAGIESPQDDDSGDLSAEAEQRGVGFYTVA